MTSTNLNQSYYGQLTPGRDDYWRWMAAPRHRVSVILREISRVRPGSIVDLGCGGGNLLGDVAFRFRSVRLSGIDLSQEQIEANRATRPTVGWHALDLMEGIPVGSELHGQFDLVIASELIEHVPDPARLLEQAASLSAPGEGQLILSTQSGPVRETENRVGHLRHFSIEEIRTLLEEGGWTPGRIWNTGYPFHDLSKWWANRNPDASMSRFGDRAYGVSEHAVCLALRALFLLNSSRIGSQLFAFARRA